MEKTSKFKSIIAKIRGKKTNAEFALYIFMFALFAVFALSYLYVLVWCFFSGLKTHDQIVLNPFGLPSKWAFGHYIEVFSFLEVNNTKFAGLLFNSVYFSVVSSVISILTTGMLSYVSAKYTFPGNKLLFFVSIIIMILPLYGTGGASFKLVYNLGLTNTYLHVILSVGSLGGSYLYFYSYYKTLSWTYAESALIDGANHFQIFFKIMLPLSMPIFGALFLLAWMGKWSSYADSLIYYPKLPTLGVGLYLFKSQMIYNVRYDILFAACFISCIPTLIIFVAFNRVLMNNITFGGVKE